MRLVLTVYRGDTKKYKWTITDPVTGLAVDVRNHYLYFTVKEDPAAADNTAIISIKQVIPNNSEAQAGIAYIEVPSTDTDVLVPDNDYTYDFQYVVPGVPPYVQTLDSGKLKVKQDVTAANT